MTNERSPWPHIVELQHGQAQQKAGGFLTLQLVKTLLVLPLGIVLCLSASHR